MKIYLYFSFFFFSFKGKFLNPKKFIEGSSGEMEQLFCVYSLLLVEISSTSHDLEFLK